MTNYSAKITQDATGFFFAMIIRTDKDGEQQIANDYNCRYFKTLKSAQKSTSAYLAKI